MEVSRAPKKTVDAARAHASPVVHVDEEVRHDADTLVAVASASQGPIPSDQDTLLIHATRRRVKAFSPVEEAMTRRLVQCAIEEISWTIRGISAHGDYEDGPVFHAMDLALRGPRDVMAAPATRLVIRQALQDWYFNRAADLSR